MSSPFHSSSLNICSTLSLLLSSTVTPLTLSIYLLHWPTGARVQEGDEEIQPQLGCVWGRQETAQAIHWGHQISGKHSLLTMTFHQRASCLFPVHPPPEHSLWITWALHHSDTRTPFLHSLRGDFLRGTVPLVHGSLKYRDRLWIVI